jgi:hypothetical protein
VTVVRIWFREGEKPKCVAPDTLPRLPGRVVDVRARSLDEALKILRLAERDAGDAPVNESFKVLVEWSARKAESDAARLMIREVPRA